MNPEQFDSDALTEAEFLGCILKDSDKLDEFSGMFDKHDFVHPMHLAIWNAIGELNRRNLPTNVKSLCEVDGSINRDYVYDMIGHAVSANMAKYYAEKMTLNSTYRKMHAYASKLLSVVNDREKETPGELLSEADSLLLRLRQKETRSMKHIGEMVESFKAHLNSHSNLVQTGRKAFDAHYGGIPRKALYILAGKPGMGKTAMALQTAYHMASQDEGAVLFWSQEMPAEEVLERLGANISGVNYGRITRKLTNEEEQARVIGALQHLGQYPFHIDDTPRVKSKSVRATANMFKRRYGKIGAIVIDYLSMMDIEQKSNQSFPKAVGEIAFDSKALAKELDCPVILCCQINREGVEAERPQSHHLKESGDIEQAADFIEILWEDKDAQPANQSAYRVITSTMTKGRRGGTAEFQYKFIGSIQRMEVHETVQEYKTDDEGHLTNHKPRGRSRHAN